MVNETVNIVCDFITLLILACMLLYMSGEKDLYRNYPTKRFLNLLFLCAFYSVFSIISDFIILSGVFSTGFIPAAVFNADCVLSQLVAQYLAIYIIKDARSFSTEFHRTRGSIIISSFLFLMGCVLLFVNALHPFIFIVTDEGVMLLQNAFLIYMPLAIGSAYVSMILVREQKYLLPPVKKMKNYLPMLVFSGLVFQIAFPAVNFLPVIFMVLVFFIFMTHTSSAFLVDPATGLGNIRLFSSSAEYYFRKGTEFSVVALTIPEYEMMKANLSYETMEKLCRMSAERLVDVPGVWQVFRISDYTFVMLAPPPSDSSCHEVCRQICVRMNESLSTGSVTYSVASRIFLIPCPVIAKSTTEVFSILRMLEASRKSFISNSYPVRLENISFSVFDFRMKETFTRKDNIRAMMKEACLTDGFEAWFQPVYDKTGKKMRACECLVRLYDRKSETYVSPEEFISIAEDEGYIDDITLFTLSKSCELVRYCIDNCVEPPVVSVNLAYIQFFSQEMLKRISDTIHEYCIPESCIKIEITETSIIDNYTALESVMKSFEKNGISFWLDDFGSGYSSISRYINLPFEGVKLDVYLLASAIKSHKADVFLRSVISSFRKLDVTVIFEGVETKEQYDYVSSLDEDVLIQGYWFSRPVCLKDIKKLLSPDS